MLKHFNSNRLQRNLLCSFQICGSLRTNTTISGNRNYFQPTTQIEPFRIKVVQHIKFRAPEEREIALKKAHYNVFLLKSEDVVIDLLTDSGTGALSDEQWSAIMKGDESYAGSPSFYRFAEVVKKITGMPYFYPTHQGRAAESILFKSWPLKKNQLVLNNAHFDTTRANIEAQGTSALDLSLKDAFDWDNGNIFRGNMDIERLENILRLHEKKIPIVMITVTSNSVGGPVSMENIEASWKIAKKYDKQFIIDACRVAENSWFIKKYEPGYENWTPLEIVKKILSYADVVLFSAKKDGLQNIGGFVAMHDENLSKRCKTNLLLQEGFPTYGGLAGRDLEAVAVGIMEAMEPSYLEYRINSIAEVAQKIKNVGYSCVGNGHAIYINAKPLLPHVPYPALALVNELYLKGGIRGVEIGSVMFGLKPDGEKGFIEEAAPMEFVRLAFPRRMYSSRQYDYVVEVLEHIYKNKDSIQGYKIISDPEPLRHFTAQFEIDELQNIKIF